MKRLPLLHQNHWIYRQQNTRKALRLLLLRPLLCEVPMCRLTDFTQLEVGNSAREN
jgi:hypothetical protein